MRNTAVRHFLLDPYRIRAAVELATPRQAACVRQMAERYWDRPSEEFLTAAARYLIRVIGTRKIEKRYQELKGKV